MFLAVDENGNELIIKVDSWEGGVTDPTAPEAQYEAVEVYLAEQGIDATVIDHAIKAGSYKGNSGGGIFESDGSRVSQSDIQAVDENGEAINWFGEAWTGNAFNGENVDFEVDFDNLPEAEAEPQPEPVPEPGPEPGPEPEPEPSRTGAGARARARAEPEPEPDPVPEPETEPETENEP